MIPAGRPLSQFYYFLNLFQFTAHLSTEIGLDFLSSLFDACSAFILSLTSVGITSFVLNFVILERQYFAGFYFRNFNRQLSKNGIRLRDSSVLNFILCFKKMELFYISDKLEQADEDERYMMALLHM